MPSYVFLDTWVLEEYTKEGWRQQLSNFLDSHRYTIVITSSLLTELYNEGWPSGGPSERGARAAAFLARQHCVVADPYKVQQAEFAAFPKLLREMPIELDLDGIRSLPREQALLRFLRRDDIFVQMGKDVHVWADGMARAKAEWPATVTAIIENALMQGVLLRDAKGHFVTPNREVFLTSLDLRLLEGGNIDPYLGRAALLRRVRLSSLVFWHRYIDPRPNHRFQAMPSDLADVHNISLMPYCNAITVDTKMLPTAQLAAEDARSDCKILGKRELEDALRQTGMQQ